MEQKKAPVFVKKPHAELRWELQEILPGLFLGPTSLAKIHEYGIEAVLCARGELALKVPDRLPLLWLKGFMDTSDPAEVMPQCIEFLNLHWNEGKKKTLICCATGAGRSAVICALYMCVVQKWEGETGFYKAVEEVETKRTYSFNFPDYNKHFFPLSIQYLEKYDFSSSFTIHIDTSTFASSSSSSSSASSSASSSSSSSSFVSIGRGASAVSVSEGIVRVTGTEGGIVRLEIAQGAFESGRAAFSLSPWPIHSLEGLQFNDKSFEDRSLFEVEFDDQGMRVVFGPVATEQLNQGGSLTLINQYR